jgi:hypothetical protein
MSSHVRYCKLQASGTITIVMSMALAAGAPDTAANNTITCIGYDPDGALVTFDAPTISELGTDVGVFSIVFSSSATNKLFTTYNTQNPYTLLVKGTTAGGTQYRPVYIYCVDRLPGENALSTEVAALDTVVDTMATATNLATVDTVVDSILAGMATATALSATDTVVDSIYAGMALETTLAATDTVVDNIYAGMATATALSTVDTVVDTIATNLATVDTVVDALPTLAQIEASTVLAKAAATDFLLKCIKNRKKVKVISGVLYLIIYDDDNTAEILRKAIKDVDGADVADPASGVIAFETKSTV